MVKKTYEEEKNCDYKNQLNGNQCYFIICEYSKEKINNILNSLTEKEQEIFKHLYGVNCYKKTKKQIAEILKISEVNIAKVALKIISQAKMLYPKDFSSVSRLFYNKYDKFGEENVNAVLHNLDENIKETLIMYYGINVDKIPTSEICKNFNIDKGTLYNWINKGERIILKELKNIEEAKIEGAFYLKFKEYSKEDIDKALSKLDSEEKSLLISYYGLGDERLEYAQLLDKYKLKTLYKPVNKAIRAMNNYLKSKKDEFYANFVGISKEIIDEALSKIDSKLKGILVSYYGLDGERFSIKDICKIYKIKSTSIQNYLKKGISHINKILNQECVRNSYMEKFYSNFEGYNKEQIDNALSQIDEKLRKILSLYYGIEGEKLKCSEISEKYNISASNLCGYYLKKGTEKVKRKLEELYIVNTDISQQSFYKIFEGYSKKEIDDAMLIIDSKAREIIISYYRLDDGFYHNQFNQEYGEEKLNYYINLGISNIKRILNKSKLEKMKKYQDNFYNKFEGLKKEEVDKALSQIDENIKNMLVLYYGLDGIKFTGEEIKSKYNLSSSVEWLLKKAIDQVNGILGISNKKDTLVYKNKFYSQFKEFTKEEVYGALDILEEKYFNIIKLYYGLDGYKPLVKEIALKYNFNPNSIDYYLKKAISEIKTYLTMEKKTFDHKDTIIKYFRNYDQTEVNYALMKLKDEDIVILAKYLQYGENKVYMRQLAKKYNLEKNTIDHSKCIIKQIENLLNPKAAQFYQYFGEYDKKKIINAFSKMDSKSKDILSLYYGLNCDILSSKKIREKYELDRSTFNSIIIEALKKINNSLILDDSIKSFYNNFPEFTQKQVDDAISKLDDGVKELLVLYYGLKGDRYTKSELAKKRLQSYSSIDYQINQNLNLVKRELVLELLKNINENERLKVMNNLFFSQIKLNDINELKEAFSTLKPIEIRLLKLYFGLDGKNVVSIENLCQILNITKKEKLISKVEIIMNKINSYIPKDNNIKIKNK